MTHQSFWKKIIAIISYCAVVLCFFFLLAGDLEGAALQTEYFISVDARSRSHSFLPLHALFASDLTLHYLSWCSFSEESAWRLL